MSDTRGSGGQATVLIVDDEVTNIRVLREVLRNFYQLRFATDGQTALEIVADQKIDLVLLDVVMPGMDGYEICRRLKSEDATQRIPVIFVTSMGEVADETQGFALGGVDYITKPVSPPIVRARVRTHLAMKEQADLLERLSTVDVLTKIANRRRFDEVLQRELVSARRGHGALTVMLLDVDFFKQYNDFFGHTRGDDCLRAIAQVLEQTMARPTDLVARYGGEEFGVVLRETDFDGCCALVTRVLENVDRLKLAHPESMVATYVTLSAGAVSFVPTAVMTPTEAVEEADTLLYEAKEGGRRRGVCRDLDSGARRVLVLPEGDGSQS